jgi:hypothetical protein
MYKISNETSEKKGGDREKTTKSDAIMKRKMYYIHKKKVAASLIF